MRTDTLSKIGRVVGLLATVTLLFVFFLMLVRPWYLHWGATFEEATARLPGDELVDAGSQSTRALTIEAPAARVWPWLLQLGQDRGGFYSYELLENMVGTDMHNVDTLRPELQHWKLGDKLWMYPPDKLAGAGHAVLRRLEPERALAFGTRQFGTEASEPIDGSWTFVLQPVDEHATRLIVRGRGELRSSRLGRLFDRLVFEPVHFMMERKMMEGIKARAEGKPATPLTDMLEVVIIACSFALLLVAALRVVRWPRSPRLFVFILAAALAFQLLTFVQPPWIVGLVLLAMLSVLFEYASYA